jgi:thiol-disulfide isomerase/thioredoxin
MPIALACRVLLLGLTLLASEGSEGASREPPRLRIGASLPALTVPRLGGDPVNLDALHGKVAVLATYAHYCDACHRMLPVLLRLVRQVRNEVGRDIPLFVVALGGAPEPAVTASTGADVTWLIDQDGQAEEALDPQTLPCTFIVDASGTIRQINRGFGSGYEKRVAGWLRSLAGAK